MDNELEGGSDLGRRTMLRRTAMAGVAVWTIPVVQTIGQGVAAASTLQLSGCPDDGSAKPSLLSFTYSPGAEAGSNAAMSGYGGTTPPADPNLSVTITANIVIPANQVTPLNGATVKSGQTFTIGTAGDCQVGKGLGNEVLFTLTWPAGVYPVGTPLAGQAYPAGTQTIQVHTSCSYVLVAGQRYASLTLNGGIFEC